MSVKPEGLLWNIKIANVFHYPVQAENMNFNQIFTFYIINQIYLIIIHPNPQVILIKRNILSVTEVLEQPGSETSVHNVLTQCEWCHANVDKQSNLLGYYDATPPRGAV